MSQTSQTKKTQVDTGDNPTYWLKPEQIEDMRTATVTQSAHYLADRNDALIALIADTGLRVNETRLLDASMIEWDDSVLGIPAEIQKGYDPEKAGGPKFERIGLKSDTLRTLRKYVNHHWYRGKETDALFPARSSDRISTQGIRDVVSKAAVSAEVIPYSTEGKGSPNEVGPHTLRHSVAYRMVEREGEQLVKVMNRLRHSSLSTTQAYYSHFDVV